MPELYSPDETSKAYGPAPAGAVEVRPGVVGLPTDKYEIKAQEYASKVSTGQYNFTQLQRQQELLSYPWTDISAYGEVSKYVKSKGITPSYTKFMTSGSTKSYLEKLGILEGLEQDVTGAFIVDGKRTTFGRRAGIENVRTKQALNKLKVDIVTTTDNMVRDIAYMNLYGSIPNIISSSFASILLAESEGGSAPHAYTSDELLSMLKMPANATADELATMKKTIEDMIVELTNRETQDMAKEAKNPDMPPYNLPLEQPKPVGMSKMTVELIKGALTAPRVPDQVASQEEYKKYLFETGQVKNLGDSLTYQQLAEDAIDRLNQTKLDIEAFQTGLGKMPSYNWWSLVSEAWMTPGLAMADVGKWYNENVNAPIAGMAFGWMFPSVSGARRVYGKQYGFWEGNKKAWLDLDTDEIVGGWWSKLVLEASVDPMNLIGTGVLTRSGKLIGGRLGTILGGIDTGWNQLVDIPFDWIKSGIGKIPKTIGQRAYLIRAAEEMEFKAGMEIYALSKGIKGRWYGGFAQKDLKSFIEYSLDYTAKHPDSVEPLAKIGRGLMRYNPITVDDLKGWGKTIGSKLDTGLITTTDAFNANKLYDLFHSTGRPVKEIAGEIAGLLDTTSDDAVDKMVTILTKKKDLVRKEALALADAGTNYRPLSVLGNKTYDKVVKNLESEAYQQALKHGRINAFLDGVAIPTQRIWATYIDKIMQPFARAYLTFGMYGPMNVVEDILRTELGGVGAKRMSSMELEIALTGLKYPSEFINFNVASEQMGFWRSTMKESQKSNPLLVMGTLAASGPTYLVTAGLHQVIPKVPIITPTTFAKGVEELLVTTPGRISMGFRMNFVYGKYKQLLEIRGGDLVQELAQQVAEFTGTASKTLNKNVQEFAERVSLMGDLAPDALKNGKDLFTVKKIQMREVRKISQQYPDLPLELHNQLAKLHEDGSLFVKGAESIKDGRKLLEDTLNTTWLKNMAYTTEQVDDMVKVLKSFGVNNPEDTAQYMMQLGYIGQAYDMVPKQSWNRAVDYSMGLPHDARYEVLESMRKDIREFRDKTFNNMKGAVDDLKGKIGGKQPAIPDYDIGLGEMPMTEKEAQRMLEYEKLPGANQHAVKVDNEYLNKIRTELTKAAESVKLVKGDLPNERFATTLKAEMDNWFTSSDNFSLQLIGKTASQSPEYLTKIRGILNEKYPSGYIRIYRGSGKAKNLALDREFTNVTSSRKTAIDFEDTWELKKVASLKQKVNTWEPTLSQESEIKAFASDNGVSMQDAKEAIYGKVFNVEAPQIDNVLVKVDDVVSIGSVDESELIIPSAILKDRIANPLKTPEIPKFDPSYLSATDIYLNVRMAELLDQQKVLLDMDEFAHNYFIGVTKEQWKDPTFWDAYRAGIRKYTDEITNTSIKYTGTIKSAMDDVHKAGGIIEPTRPPVKIVGAPSPENVAQLLGCRINDLTTSMLSTLTVYSDKDLFVDYVMKMVRPDIDTGWTKQGVESVYDQIITSMGLDPAKMDWLAPKLQMLDGLEKDLQDLFVSKSVKPEDLEAISKYLDDTASKIENLVYEKPPTTIERAEEFLRSQQKGYVAPELKPSAVRNLNDKYKNYQTLRQESLDESTKLYYKEYTDYTNANAIDAMMTHIYPYWRYESQRYFWLPRSFLQHPGTFTGLARYMDASDKGYSHIPGTNIDINMFRSTIYGSLVSSSKRDYPEYYDSIPGASLLIQYNDELQRRGFYPGQPFPIILSLIGGDKPQLGENLPAMASSVLNTAIAMFPDNKAIKFISEKVFPDRFKDYLTIKYVDMNGGNGSLINAKISEKKPLTEEEQSAWDMARGQASWSSAGFEQFALFRFKPQEQLDIQKACAIAIEDMTGISPEMQDWYRDHGENIWDKIGGMSPSQQAILQALGYYKYTGATTPLLPSNQQVFVNRLEIAWNDVTTYSDSVVMNGKLQLQKDFLTGVVAPSDYSARLSDLYNKQRVYIETKMIDMMDVPLPPELTGDERSRFIEEHSLMSLAGRTAFYKENNKPLPVLSPFDELLNLYYSIQLHETIDPETGERIKDWDRFWSERSAVESAIPPEYQQEWESYLTKNSTRIEGLRKLVNDRYFEKYNGMYDFMLERFTPDEQTLIKEYYYLKKMGKDLSRQTQIEEMITKGGTKLISTLSSNISDGRKALRYANPHLDAWLFYWGKTTSFMTSQAETIFHQIVRETGRQP